MYILCFFLGMLAGLAVLPFLLYWLIVQSERDVDRRVSELL
jgi:hypothetical protein